MQGWRRAHPHPSGTVAVAVVDTGRWSAGTGDTRPHNRPSSQQHQQESRCAFVLLLMIVYWIFQPIPLPVTALLPVALFPLLGLASTEKACEPYLKSTNMLFMASLIVAIAMESSGF